MSFGDARLPVYWQSCSRCPVVMVIKLGPGGDDEVDLGQALGVVKFACLEISLCRDLAGGLRARLPRHGLTGSLKIGPAARQSQCAAGLLPSPTLWYEGIF